MASYNPPLRKSDLSFNVSNFDYQNDNAISYADADQRYLKKTGTDSSIANTTFTKTLNVPSLTFTSFLTPTVNQLGYTRTSNNLTSSTLTTATQIQPVNLTNLVAGAYVVNINYSYTCITAGIIAYENVNVSNTNFSIQTPNLEMVATAGQNVRTNSTSYVIILNQSTTTITMNLTITFSTGSFNFTSARMNATRIA